MVEPSPHVPRVVLVAAPTKRTKAYAAALGKLQLEVAGIALYGVRRIDDFPDFSLPPSTSPAWGSLPSWIRTDWNESWDTLSSQVDPSIFDAPTASHQDVQDFLEDKRPDIVIFSGFPGEIVKSWVVERWSFLHVHPGRLPSFRGSTVIYWALLHDAPIVCSVILLEEKIDQGPVLFEVVPPQPQKLGDVDGLYDPAIRALALHDFFKHLSTESGYNRQLSLEKPEDYFVIHPVLKCFALAKLGGSNIIPPEFQYC